MSGTFSTDSRCPTMPDLHGTHRIADEADQIHVSPGRDQRRGHRQEGVTRPQGVQGLAGEGRNVLNALRCGRR